MFRMRNAVAVSLVLLAASAVAQQLPDVQATAASAGPTDSKPGYWFYKEPPPPPPEGEEPQEFPELGPPPDEKALLSMHPKQVEKLIEQYRQHALWKMSEREVTWYYQLQDFARRRSRAFMNVTDVVMLQNPALNMNTSYPTNMPGMNARQVQRDSSMSQRLAQERQAAALILLTRPECGFCEAQRGTLKYFQEKHGWEIREMDLNRRPDLAARFATNYTPTTIVIFRGTDKWMPVAVGVETVPRIEEAVYGAVRMIRGETSADQFTLQEFQDGGVLDPKRRNP